MFAAAQGTINVSTAAAAASYPQDDYIKPWTEEGSKGWIEFVHFMALSNMAGELP
jgi:hypothetical protein